MNVSTFNTGKKGENEIKNKIHIHTVEETDKPIVKSSRTLIQNVKETFLQ